MQSFESLDPGRLSHWTPVAWVIGLGHRVLSVDILSLDMVLDPRDNFMTKHSNLFVSLLSIVWTVPNCSLKNAPTWCVIFFSHCMLCFFFVVLWSEGEISKTCLDLFLPQWCHSMDGVFIYHKGSGTYAWCTYVYVNSYSMKFTQVNNCAIYMYCL